MILKEDGHLDFEQISKMNAKELVNECSSIGKRNALYENFVPSAKIPLEDMRKLTKIMYQKKWEEKYGCNL